jgi:hypothetical protein
MSKMSMRNRHRGMPPIPPEVDLLRRAVKTINPHQVYEMVMPDGTTVTTTGAEMIETADAYIALADASRASNWRGMVKALVRIGGLP